MKRSIGWRLGFRGRRAVQRHLDDCNLILAIKEVRRRTGDGLKESKAYVDNLL